MTINEFLGCSLIGFGPPIILFILTIANDPLLIIVFVASAFFWILSLLISAAWWMIVFPLKDYPAFGLVFSVLFQEVFRFLFYLLMRGANKGLKQVWVMEGSHSASSIMSSNMISFVAGLGYGSVSCTFSLVNLLAALYGPGTVGLHGSHPDFSITSAFLSLGFFFLHTFWNILFFNGFQNKRYGQPVIVVASHLLISCFTITNKSLGPLFSLAVAYLLVLMTMGWAFVLIGGTRKKIIRSISRIRSPATD